jgi:fructokinase
LVTHFSKQTDTVALNDEAFLLRALFEHGAKKIALTDGMRGAWGYDGAEMLHALSRVPEQGVDTTGAGDAFGSGFLAAEISGKSLAESLQWGMANGASVVRHYGAIEGLLRREEIEAHIGDIAVESVIL